MSWPFTGPVVRTPTSLPRVQVPSLVGELRSCKLCGRAKKKKKNQVSWHQEPMRAHLGVSHLTHTGRVCVCVCVCRVDVRMASWRGQSFRSWPGRGRRKNISSEGDHLCKGQEQKPRGMRNRKHKPQRLMVCLFSGLWSSSCSWGSDQSSESSQRLADSLRIVTHSSPSRDQTASSPVPLHSGLTVESLGD